MDVHVCRTQQSQVNYLGTEDRLYTTGLDLTLRNQIGGKWLLKIGTPTFWQLVKFASVPGVLSAYAMCCSFC